MVVTDRWVYRKVRSWRLGHWRIGYERRDYGIEIPVIVMWPRIWKVSGGDD